jgi:hypothetical protein
MAKDTRPPVQKETGDPQEENDRSIRLPTHIYRVPTKPPASTYLASYFTFVLLFLRFRFGQKMLSVSSTRTIWKKKTFFPQFARFYRTRKIISCIMRHRLVTYYQRFGRSYCFHLQDKRVSYELKLEMLE